MNPEHQALWYAAFTLYGRAFGNGVRHTAKPSTAVFDDAQRAAHEFVLQVRNKYIAHSVNGFEQSRTWALLDYSGGGKPALVEAGVHHVALTQLTNDKARLVISLCDSQIADYLRRIEMLTKTVLEECRKLGPRAIEKGTISPTLSLTRPGLRSRGVEGSRSSAVLPSSLTAIASSTAGQPR